MFEKAQCFKKGGGIFLSVSPLSSYVPDASAEIPEFCNLLVFQLPLLKNFILVWHFILKCYSLTLAALFVTSCYKGKRQFSN